MAVKHGVVLMSEVRSAAAMAGVCDEQRLIHDASAAFTRSEKRCDLDSAWRDYVYPVWEQIDGETQDILSRLYSLRLSTLSWEL
jgi:hypothetical protein